MVALFNSKISQRGAASLLAVSFASIIILLITVAMAGMMVGELRKATDAENSIRAYYAAESGAEEALLGIKKRLSSVGLALSGLDQSCDNTRHTNPFIGKDNSLMNTTDGSVQITCRKINTLGTPEGIILHDQAAQIDLTSTNPTALPILPPDNYPGKLTISWDSPDPNDASFNPPTLEVAITNYPKGSITGINGVPTRNLLLVPCQGAAPCIDRKAASINAQLVFAAGPAASQLQTRCSTNLVSGGYRCVAVITNLAPSTAYENVVRLRPLQSDMRYSMVVSSITGYPRPLKVRLQNAYIDVTARVGDSYRRIQQDVEVRAGAFAGLDVISAQQGICKDFDVLVAPGYQAVNPKTCPLPN